jgi:hypothetical protein
VRLLLVVISTWLYADVCDKTSYDTEPGASIVIPTNADGLNPTKSDSAHGAKLKRNMPHGAKPMLHGAKPHSEIA